MSGGLMSIGMRAMAASYAAMQTTGHNIANASVAGYSRQQVDLQTAKGQFVGGGFIGKGVDVASVTRSYDQFLTTAAVTAKSLAAKDQARSDNLAQLEQVFQTGQAGLGQNVGQFLNSMVDLATQPADSSTRQVVLSNAQQVASQFNDASNQFDSLQAGVTSDLATSVTTINGLTKSIAAVNQQIAAVKGLGQPPNDLLDQRDQLISQLGGYLQVSTVPADDGTVGVFIAGGQKLVLGTQADALQVVPDPVDSSRSALALNQSGTLRVFDSSALGGGSIAGLMNFQNHDLVQARNLVGQMATAVAGAVNKQQQLGLNLQQPLGGTVAQPLFAIGAPRVSPAASNVRDASGKFVSSASMTIVDPSLVQAADYELRADPGGVAGKYQLTRLSTPPVVSTISSGDVVDGVRFDVGSPPPAATDRFLMQPVGQAAAGMAVLLQDPRDLAAASPLTASTASANTGSATVASLKMLTPPPQPGASASISFTSNTGDYTWQLTDAANNVISSGSGTWQAGQPIPAPPADINGFALQLAGVPRSGDVLTVAPTPATSLTTNNGNALALASLRDATFVGNTLQTDGSVSGGATATDAYASAMAAVGVDVQTAASAAKMSSSASSAAEAARASVSGVNLDEEAANLIQYQQAYQAASKVLQVAQSIFATLLQTVSA